MELEYFSSAARFVAVALSDKQDRNYKFSVGDWVAGQAKPIFETFASALLAGI